MTERTNEYQELLEDLKYIVSETIADEWHDACHNYDFNVEEDHEAYGDTYVSSGTYITDKESDDFRDKFEWANEPNDLIDKLRLNPQFCECLKNLVKEFTKTAEIEF